MPRLLLVSLAVFCGAASVAAQIFVPDSNPTIGGCNLIPFGLGSGTSTTWANHRYQVMVTQAQLGNAQVLQIHDLAFASCGIGLKHFDSIEIRIGQTNAATLSKTFAANLVSNVKTVLQATDYDWYHATGTWDRIGLDQSYQYVAPLGANLVVEIITTGCRGLLSNTRPGQVTGTTLPRIFAYGWTGAPPATGSTDTGTTQAGLKMEVVIDRSDIQVFGQGCAGVTSVPVLSVPSGATARLGGTVSISCTQCRATTPLLHVFGLRRLEPALDLGVLGAAGCRLYQSVDVLLAGTSDGAGVYRFSSTIPNDRKLVGFRIYTQVFPLDPGTNGWNRVATNYARILPGTR